MGTPAKSLAALGAAAVALTLPAAAAAKKTPTTTLRMQSTNVVVTPLDIGPAGKSPGDVYVFDGDVELKGRKVGRLYGSNTSIEIAGSTETVAGQTTFHLGGGDSIVTGGTAEYPSDDSSGWILNKTFTRVIFGGTGKYFGVGGTITTTRVSASVYRHVLRMTRP